MRRITGVGGAGAGVDAGGSRVRAVGKAAGGVVGADEGVDDDEGWWTMTTDGGGLSLRIF